MEHEILSRNKVIASFAIIIGLFVLATVLHQVFSYKSLVMANLDTLYPDFVLNNVGGLNQMAYFTVLSNTLSSLFLITYGLAIFRIKFAKRIAYNPLLQGMITEYIFITGIVYCSILIWFQKPMDWNSPLAFYNIINYIHHIPIPIIMTLIWFYPLNDRKINTKNTYLFLIFPIIYLVFSIIRGIVMSHHFYPYVFLNPHQLWVYIGGDNPFNFALAFSLVIIFLALLTTLFYFVAKLLIKIHNSRIDIIYNKRED